MKVKAKDHEAYKSWDSMIQRCTNKNHQSYKRYGGRGISVCDEWKNSKNFTQWCDNNGFKNGLTIDRIDNDKGYSPSNCRWITKKDQKENKNIQTNNKSGYRGVWFNVKINKYESSITLDRKKITIGYFTSLIQAVIGREFYKIKNNIKLTADIHSNDIEILKWGATRQLFSFNKNTEILMLEEEIEEFNKAESKADEYEMVDAILDEYIIFTQTLGKASLAKIDIDKNIHLSKYLPRYINAKKRIEKLGYSFDKALSETIKEINSRKGSISSDGKWRKDKIQNNLYKADYSTCKLLT